MHKKIRMCNRHKKGLYDSVLLGGGREIKIRKTKKNNIDPKLEYLKSKIYIKIFR